MLGIWKLTTEAQVCQLGSSAYAHPKASAVCRKVQPETVRNRSTCVHTARGQLRATRQG